MRKVRKNGKGVPPERLQALALEQIQNGVDLLKLANGGKGRKKAK